MGYIYKITNLINKKAYIGETIQDVNLRWKAHKNLAKLDKGCPALKEALNKYGVENFKFEVLIICFDEDRLIYEKEYIKKYNTIAPNGYNISEGGVERGFTGLKHTDETKKKISNASKAQFANLEKRKEMSERMKKMNVENNMVEKRLNSENWIKYIHDLKSGAYKRDISAESKQKISDSIKEYYRQNKDTKPELREKLDKWTEILKNKKGMAISDVHKDKIVKGQTEYYNNIYNTFYTELEKGILLQSKRIKVIAQYDTNNTLIKLYPSISLVTKLLNVTKKQMSRILKNGDIEQNYIWRYYTVNENTEKELKLMIENKT